MSNWAIRENKPNLSRRSLWRSRNKPNSNPTCRGVASGEDGNKPNACPPSVWRIKGKKMLPKARPGVIVEDAGCLKFEIA
jgi:hypothetical protein